MKNMYFFIPVFFLAGCATSAPKTEVKNPTIVKEEVIVKEKVSETESEKICESVVDGVKWTYNKSKDVWERVSSEDNKNKLNKAWDKTKKVTKEAWDAGKKAYDEK